MRRALVVIAAVGTLGLGAAVAGETPDLAALNAESRAKIKTFAGSLKGALQAAIKEGGPVKAISVCNMRAPEIAAELSGGGWTVGRTSQRTRNPENTPDTWETMVLEAFLERAAGGESLKTMEAAAIVENGGAKTYRYMKAIPTGDVCLTCHGSDLEPELAAKIRTVYPEDRATGFALGELRGAFTITRTLE